MPRRRGPTTWQLHAGADVITHMPLGSHLSAKHAAALARDSRIAVPTLTIAQGKADKIGKPDLYLRAGPPSLSCARLGYRSWPGRTPTPRPARLTQPRSRTATASITSSSCSLTPA